jgi:hypothetical protein
MRDDLTALKGIVSTLVHQLQSSAADLVTKRRNTSPTSPRSNFALPADSPALVQPTELTTTSDDSIVYTIGDTKGLIAGKVLENYILNDIAKNPFNVVINGEDEASVSHCKDRINTVLNYMKKNATAAEMLTLNSKQPDKNCSAWLPWSEELRELCTILQNRSMDCLLALQNADLTAEEISKSKEKFPTISGMEGRIKRYCKKRKSEGDQPIDSVFKRVDPSGSASSSSSSSSSSMLIGNKTVGRQGSLNTSTSSVRANTSSSSSKGKGVKGSKAIKAKISHVHSSKNAQTIRNIAPLKSKL